jgi:hypothetical protein
MPQAMIGERLAIQGIRDRHEKVPLTKLAKRITTKDFPIDSEDYKACVRANVPTRTYYSVYSVLRRYVKTRADAIAANMSRPSFA